MDPTAFVIPCRLAGVALDAQQVGVFGQFVLDKVHRRNSN